MGDSVRPRRMAAREWVAEIQRRCDGDDEVRRHEQQREESSRGEDAADGPGTHSTTTVEGSKLAAFAQCVPGARGYR